MKTLPNFNFDVLDTFDKSVLAIVETIEQLKLLVIECDDILTKEDKEQFIKNIEWLKRFYESAERNLLDDRY